jgi:23S rRNA (adenine2503-C2)-methyltransferase
MDLDLLDATLDERGDPSYRAGQVWKWLAGGARSYEAMTNLPADLRTHLAERVPFSTLTLAARSNADDGTEKALLRTADGKSVEAVLMRFRDGRR